MAQSNGSICVQQGRNEVYAIRDQRPTRDRDQGSQPWDLGSQRVGSGSAVFHGIRDQANIKKRFRDKNSHRFWDKGSTF